MRWVEIGAAGGGGGGGGREDGTAVLLQTPSIIRFHQRDLELFRYVGTICERLHWQ